MKLFRRFKNIFENKLIALAGLMGMILGPMADALGSNIWYWLLVGILISLIIYALYDEAKRYDRLNQNIVHLPLVIRIDDKTDGKYVLSTLLKKIENETSVDNYAQNLLKYREINVEDFIFEYNGSIYDFDRLLSFARIISYKVNSVEKELGTKVRFHVAYYRRPSVAFMLGVIFRTEGIILYQNNDAGETFEQVANINTRRYKEKVSQFTKYTIEEDFQDIDNSDEVVIIISSASHDINKDEQVLQKYNNKIIVKVNGNGTIDYNDEWSFYSQEIYTVIHNARMRFKKLTIVHAMPEALALLVGMAIENYWNIEITQYDNGDYKHMYNMQDIKFYF